MIFAPAVYTNAIALRQQTAAQFTLRESQEGEGTAHA